jgi:hypothetical protein
MRCIDADILFNEVGKIKPRNSSHDEAIGEFMNMITNSPTVYDEYEDIIDQIENEVGFDLVLFNKW